MKSSVPLAPIFGVAAAVLVLLVACDSITGPEPPDGTPFLTAALIGVNLDTYPGGTHQLEKPNLVLRGGGEHTECCIRAGFLYDPEILFRTSRGNYFPIDLSDLEPGLLVEAWIRPGEGIESSCPTAFAPTYIVVSPPR